MKQKKNNKKTDYKEMNEIKYQQMQYTYGNKNVKLADIIIGFKPCTITQRCLRNTVDISLKVSAKDKVKIIKIFEIDRRRINNKTQSIFEMICTYVKESQNCRVWKGPQEIIGSSLPVKAVRRL